MSAFERRAGGFVWERPVAARAGLARPTLRQKVWRYSEN
jgi:hypothetical protein